MTSVKLIFFFFILSFSLTLFPQEAPLEELLFPEDVQTITGSKTLMKAKESPAVISVITDKMIRDRGCESVAEALSSAPGLSLWRDNLITSVGMRGINSVRGWNQTIKVMIDSQPVALRYSSISFLDREIIPIRAVKRIEIIRGPASSLYGANAFLGVINIITKDVTEKNADEVTASWGESGDYSGDFILGSKSRGFNYLVSGSASYTDRSGLRLPEPVPDNYKGLKSEGDISQPRSFFGKVSFGNFKFDASIQEIDRFGEFTDFSVLTHHNRLNFINWYARSAYHLSLGKNFNFNTSLAYNSCKPGSRDHLDVGYPFMWIKRDVGSHGLDFISEVNYTWLKNSIRFGLDYTTDDVKLQDNIYIITSPDNPWGAVPGDELRQSNQGRKDFNNTGAFFQVMLYPYEKLGITLGTRHDWHNIYGDVNNYRVALTYSPKESLQFKLLHGTSFKAPTPAQLFDVSGKSRGNPDLNAQYAKTTEGYLRYLFTKHISAAISVFYTDITDIIELVSVQDDPYWSEIGVTKLQQNIGEINSRGFETEVEFSSENFGAYFNTSYQKSIDVKTDDRTPFVPKVMANMGINLLIHNHLNINFEYHYEGERLSPKEEDPFFKVPSANLARLTLSTKSISFFNNKETIISLKVYNLFNNKFIDPGFQNKGIDIPHKGRTLFLRLTQTF